TEDVVTVTNFFYENTPANAWNPVQEVRFEDGTVWDLATIQQQLPSSQRQSPALTRSAFFADSLHAAAQDAVFVGNYRPHLWSEEVIEGENKPLELEVYFGQLKPQDASLDSQANQLVSAMASFAPAAGGVQHTLLNEHHHVKPELLAVGLQ
ncbi:calcium-binding protein, partial [Paracidovorax sp. MALMAid1276]|uniref:calcium-binding protein n=1 Tax=Paracidovorax sp. MALMAid1276 TaxID=3411631 RepID=UPI003B9C5292